MLAKILLILTMLSALATGSGCLSLLQPRNELVEKYNFIDMEAPALRLARPVEAELLEKRDGQWVSIGKGVIPAGAYLKGRAPPTP